MKGEVVRNLRLAKKQVVDVIGQIETGKDWKHTHKSLIHSIKLIKSAMRKYIFSACFKNEKLMNS